MLITIHESVPAHNHDNANQAARTTKPTQKSAICKLPIYRTGDLTDLEVDPDSVPDGATEVEFCYAKTGETLALKKRPGLTCFEVLFNGTFRGTMLLDDTERSTRGWLMRCEYVTQTSDGSHTIEFDMPCELMSSGRRVANFLAKQGVLTAEGELRAITKMLLGQRQKL